MSELSKERLAIFEALITQNNAILRQQDKEAEQVGNFIGREDSGNNFNTARQDLDKTDCQLLPSTETPKGEAVMRKPPTRKELRKQLKK